MTGQGPIGSNYGGAVYPGGRPAAADHRSADRFFASDCRTKLVTPYKGDLRMRKRTIPRMALLAALAAGSYGWCTGSASLREIRVYAMPFAAQDQQNPKTITVPAGTHILVRLAESIDSTEQ